MRHFTILTMMGLVLAFAVGFAALRDANEYWAAGVLMMTLVLLGASVLAVVYERGQSRAGWLGFLVFGGAYMALSIGQLPSERVSARLPTTRALSYAHARVDTVGRLRGKLKFSIVDGATGKTTIDEAAIQADPSQSWKAMFPGAVNYGPFLNIGHCLFALLSGLVGAVIARWFEKRSERRMDHAV